MREKKALLFFIIIIVVFIGGFITKSLAEEKPKVVLILDNLNIEYWRTIKAGAEKGFRDFDIDGKVYAARDGSEAEQIEILKKVYKQNPDAIIVSGQSLDFIPVLDKFSDKKIPVLLISSDLTWGNKKSYVGTNNVVLGETAGAFLASQLQPRDKVALIGGDPDFSVFNERIIGYRAKLEDAGITIVEESFGVRDDAKSIRNATVKILKEHPDVKGILATHDTLALQVIKEIEKQGLTIPVIGADGSTAMLELIQDGTIPGTVAQNPFDMGYLSVEAALKATKGEKVERFIDSGVDIIVKSNAKERHEFLKKLFN